MRMEVKRDDTVRTIVATIENGPKLISGWKTWVKKPKAWRLTGVRVTVDAGELRAVVLTGPVVKKDGTDSLVSDGATIRARELERSPDWLRSLVLDLVSNVRRATYQMPEDYTIPDGYSA